MKHGRNIDYRFIALYVAFSGFGIFRDARLTSTGLHPVLMYVAPVGLGVFYDDNFTLLHRAAPCVNECCLCRAW